MGASSKPNVNIKRKSRYKKSRRAPMHEINVTPFVDVMLVLLIVFMVTAPLLTVGVPIELPETQANELSESVEPITIAITSDGKIFIQEQELTKAEIMPKLFAMSKNVKEEKIYIRADKSIDYGFVMQVMGLINKAGFTKLGLITNQEAPNNQ